MITLTKIKQLESNFSKRQRKFELIIWHDISKDGRLLDKDGYVMTTQESDSIEKSDREYREIGGKVFFEESCTDPKIKPNSTSNAYHQ